MNFLIVLGTLLGILVIMFCTLVSLMEPSRALPHIGVGVIAVIAISLLPTPKEKPVPETSYISPGVTWADYEACEREAKYRGYYASSVGCDP